MNFVAIIDAQDGMVQLSVPQLPDYIDRDVREQRLIPGPSGSIVDWVTYRERFTLHRFIKNDWGRVEAAWYIPAEKAPA